MKTFEFMNLFICINQIWPFKTALVMLFAGLPGWLFTMAEDVAGMLFLCSHKIDTSTKQIISFEFS